MKETQHGQKKWTQCDVSENVLLGCFIFYSPFLMATLSFVLGIEHFSNSNSNSKSCVICHQMVQESRKYVQGSERIDSICPQLLLVYRSVFCSAQNTDFLYQLFPAPAHLSSFQIQPITLFSLRPSVGFSVQCRALFFRHYFCPGV